MTWSALVEAGWHLGERLLYRRGPMLRGDDVAELQRRLGGLGFDAGRVDGIFGDSTARALIDFQRNSALTVDGICGPSTLAALDRLGGERTAADPVARVRERETRRRSAGGGGLPGRRVALGHDGGLDPLAAAVARALAGAGAEVTALQDPDGSAQAAGANAAGVEAYLGFRLCPDREGCSTSFYAGFRYESEAGRRLAVLLQSAVVGVLGVTDLGTHGMALPVLRETRMPAVLCEIGPPAVVVERGVELAGAAVSAVADWVSSPD
jgi:N-acetylmuramoyl-L-alanine amidase